MKIIHVKPLIAKVYIDKSY